MEKNIAKYDQALQSLEENVRFYISTPDRFAEALVFVKKLEKFAEAIKEKVKQRGAELMNEKDLREIEFGNWKVQKIDAGETVEYSVASVIDAVGLDVAKPFLKISASKLEWWIKKSRLEGETLSKINMGKKLKIRKGYIKLIEKKDESD